MIFFKFKERVSGILLSIKLQTIEKSMFKHPSHVSSIQYNVYCNFLRLSRKRNYQVSPKYAFNFDRNIENIKEVTFLTSFYVNVRHFNCVVNKVFDLLKIQKCRTKTYIVWDISTIIRIKYTWNNIYYGCCNRMNKMSYLFYGMLRMF